MTDANRDIESLSPASVGRSSFIVGAGFAGAQAVGLVRELWLAGHVGLSGTLDALLVAIGLTTLAAGIITGGASGALVPLYLESRKRQGLVEARRISGSVIAWLGLGGLAISLLVALIAPILISISGPGLSPENHDRATAYLRFLTPVMVISVITTMMKVVCQAEERFGSIALATIAGPAATVVTMLALWGPLEIDALVVGSIVGALASLAVYLWATARVSATPIFRPTTDPRLRGLLRHAFPVTISGGILELRGIVDRAVATLLGPGSVSALRYATVLLTPLTQIGPAWSSVIYPRLVHLTLGGPENSLASWSERTLRAVSAVFVPIAALTAAVAPVAVFFAYGRGAFTPEALRLTAETLAAYTPLVVTLMMLPVLVGSLNARRRGGTLLLGGALNVILNIVLDLVLAWWLGAAGIALASSIAEVLVIAMFIRSIRRSSDAFVIRPIVRTIGLSLLAVGPFAGVIAILSWAGGAPANTLTAFVTLGVYGAIGVLGYVAVASAIGISAARDLLATLGGWLQRGRPQAPPS